MVVIQYHVHVPCISKHFYHMLLSEALVATCRLASEMAMMHFEPIFGLSLTIMDRSAVRFVLPIIIGM